MNALVFNDRLANHRVVSRDNGFIVVSYSHDLCSRIEAWCHLLDHWPENVSMVRKVTARKYNPWRKCHQPKAWAWITEEAI